MAASLTEAGITPGRPGRGADAVRSRQLYISILAILAAGAAYVPVDADDPEERAELVFGEAGRRLITGAGATSRARRTGPPPAAVAARPDDDAWIIFTSGSTGHAEGRRGHPPLRRRVRRRRGPAVPAGRADRARRPRARRAVGRVRRLLRGDVARLAPRRLPRAGAARARAQRHGSRALAASPRHHGRLDRADAGGALAAESLETCDC